MDYFELWLNNIRERGSYRLTQPLTVQEEHKRHVGPRCEYAFVNIQAEPADDLKIEFDVNLDQNDRNLMAMTLAAVCGILDIILVYKAYPLCKIKLKITEIRYHTVDSHPVDFRLAGRTIGLAIMQKTEHYSFS